MSAPVGPAPFSPAWYDQPRPVSRYDRIMGGAFNAVAGVLAFLVTGSR
jgi:hypothetical protein